MPKISSGRSTPAPAAPSAFFIVSALMRRRPPALRRARHALDRPGLRICAWPSYGRLHRAAHEHQPARRAGNGTLHEQEAALGVAFDDREVERRDLGGAELAGHAHALEHAGRRRARTDRARRAVLLVVAVRRALAAEVVTLHDAAEPAT